MRIRERSSPLARLQGEAAIAVAVGVMNVAAYAYTIVAARVLGPRAYGAFASLMATLLVLGVLQLGLQATAARRIAASPQHVGQIERVILGVTYRAALGLGALTPLLSPVLALILRIDNLVTVMLVAAAVVPMTTMGGQAGILQGERRWGALALLYLDNGVPRLLVGTALVLWQPTEVSAMAGVVLGSLVPVTIGWWLLRSPRRAGRHSEEHVLRPVTREALRNSQVLLAFFALTNVDVIVARNALDGHEAGLYAGGLILAKAVLFLPQFIVIVAFPAMSDAAESRVALQRSLVAVALIGAAATGGALVLDDLALVFIGGAQYGEIRGLLWCFAALGTLLAMLQLLVYSVVARQGRRSTYLVWAALAMITLGGVVATSATALVTTVLVIDLLLLVALTLISLSRSTHAAAERRASD